MNLVIETLPADRADLPGWLERQLVGDRLADLVEELAAVTPPATPAAGTLRDRLGGVLAGGLGVLPAAALDALLARPAELLAVQELVLAEGGPYWDAVPLPPGFDEVVAAGRGRLAQALEGDEPMVPLSLAPRPRRIRWAAPVGIAAALLLGLAGGRELAAPAAPAGVAWGWARPSGLPAADTPDAYLAALADRGDEWFGQRPADAPALARRVAEYRQGCTAILLADHPALPAAQQAALKARCRAWAAKFDDQLARLEDGADPLAIRAEADAVARALSAALRGGLTAG